MIHCERIKDSLLINFVSLQDLQQDWQPLAWTVGSVCLLSRAGFMEPFVVRYTVPLGGLGSAREVNIPYVASFELEPHTSRTVKVSHLGASTCQSEKGSPQG